VPVKINMKKLEDLARQAAAAGKSRVKVGILQGSGAHAETGISLVELAAVHEFGSPSRGIPERSFIRAPLTDSLVIQTLITKLCKGSVLGRCSYADALEILGAKAAAHVKNYTKSGASPHKALKQATVNRKKSSRPLVDTGQLVNSVSYQVIS